MALTSFFRSGIAVLVMGGVLAACGPSETDSGGDGGASGGDGPPPSSVLDSLPPAPAPPPGSEAVPLELVRSQTLYVPAYSHIYIRDAARTMNLATTLSIRNTSRTDSLTLTTIDYYDSEGQKVRSYLDRTRELGPLSSTHVVVDEGDLRGGVGANFIVQWRAAAPVSPPIVEAIMITTQSTQGISFRSTARVLSQSGATTGEAPVSSTP